MVACGWPRKRLTMSSDAAGSGEPFNVSKLKELMELMDHYGLSEIDLRSGEQRWHLRRGPAEIVQSLAPGSYAGGPYSVPQFAAPQPSSAPASPAPAAPPAPV